jgi:hypothetical protein
MRGDSASRGPSRTAVSSRSSRPNPPARPRALDRPDDRLRRTTGRCGRRPRSRPRGGGRRLRAARRWRQVVVVATVVDEPSVADAPPVTERRRAGRRRRMRRRDSVRAAGPSHTIASAPLRRGIPARAMGHVGVSSSPRATLRPGIEPRTAPSEFWCWGELREAHSPEEGRRRRRRATEPGGAGPRSSRARRCGDVADDRQRRDDAPRRCTREAGRGWLVYRPQRQRVIAGETSRAYSAPSSRRAVCARRRGESGGARGRWSGA